MLDLNLSNSPNSVNYPSISWSNWYQMNNKSNSNSIWKRKMGLLKIKSLTVSYLLQISLLRSGLSNLLPYWIHKWSLNVLIGKKRMELSSLTSSILKKEIRIHKSTKSIINNREKILIRKGMIKNIEEWDTKIIIMISIPSKMMRMVYMIIWHR